MKFVTIAFLMVFASTSYAAGTLSCQAEDGSVVEAIVNSEAGSVPTQAQYSIRGSELRSARVAHYVTTTQFTNGSASGEKLETVVLADSSTGEIVMVIANGSLIDKTGNYSVDCEFGY